jgi:threonine dehydrogenase-like Zn-dependent dehydrogenase
VAKVYRGHEHKTRKGYIIGHEFTGTILSVGKGVKNFKSGDHVVSPFTRYSVGITVPDVVVPVGNVFTVPED